VTPAPIPIFQGDTGPSILDTIADANGVVDLTDHSVRFRMRLRESDSLTVDAVASIVNPPGVDGQVRYDWAPGDTDAPGVYDAWWVVTTSGGVSQSTPEFLIVVAEHAPGYSTQTGEIARRTKAIIPSTYVALSKDDDYGSELIQLQVESVKFALFQTNVPPELEGSSYEPPVLDYAAQCVAIRIIPAAIDWWASKPISITTTGTQESASYPDRRDALWKTWTMLRDAVTKRQIVIAPDGSSSLKLFDGKGTPAISQSGGNMVTPDPALWGYYYASPGIYRVGTEIGHPTPVGRW
jgi:hypothetical protein